MADDAGERNEAPRWRGQYAAHLLAEYLRVSKKRSKLTRRAETALKYEALDLLEEMGAPPSVLKLFDAMLGGVENEWRKGEPERRWVAAAIDYEARAMQDGRDAVTTAEVVDKVFLPLKPSGFDRRGALREVGSVRKADWYWSLVRSRHSALADKKE